MLTFDEKKHAYQWEGKPVLSVTQIIGAWFKVEIDGTEYYVNRFTGQHVLAYYFEAAGKFGSAVHKAVYHHIMNGLDWAHLEKKAPQLLPPLQQFLAWEEMHNPEYLMDYIEKPLYSIKHGFAGTPDIPCIIRRQYHLPDVKTGGFDEAPSQLTAYEVLLKEAMQTRRRFKKHVLKLPKKEGATFSYIPVEDDHEYHWNFFKCRQYEQRYIAMRAAS